MSIRDGDLDRQDNESWDPRHDSEFKKILNSLHEQLPDLEHRFDKFTTIKMCSRRLGDKPEEKKWFPVFSTSDFIPSVFERVHEVLLDKEDIDFEEELSHLYSLPSAAKSSQNFTGKSVNIGKRTTPSRMFSLFPSLYKMKRSLRLIWE